MQLRFLLLLHLVGRRASRAQLLCLGRRCPFSLSLSFSPERLRRHQKEKEEGLSTHPTSPSLSSSAKLARSPPLFGGCASSSLSPNRKGALTVLLELFQVGGGSPLEKKPLQVVKQGRCNKKQQLYMGGL